MNQIVTGLYTCSLGAGNKGRYPISTGEFKV